MTDSIFLAATGRAAVMWRALTFAVVFAVCVTVSFAQGGGAAKSGSGASSGSATQGDGAGSATPGASAQGGTTPANADGESAIELVREALAKHAQLQDLISKERNEWRRGKNLLAEQIELTKIQIERTREQIKQVEVDIEKADLSRAKLVTTNERLKGEMAALDGAIAGFEVKTKALLPRLPALAAEKIARFSQRLPAEPETSELDAARRYPIVVGILNDLNRFNREISTASERRKLGADLEAEVTSIYIGLGQGYYVTLKGDAGGVGRATETGWEWKAANESAEAIAQIAKILNGEQPAAFVGVPVRIQ